MNTTINATLATAFAWNWRLFALLLLLGLTGVLTLLLIPITLPTGNAQLPSLATIRLIQIVQTSVMLTLAVAVGCWAAPRLGLNAPLLAAWAEGRSMSGLLSSILMSSLLIGTLGGILASAISLLAQPYLPTALTDPNSAANTQPLLVRFLYGGILEEILLRWGLMSGIAWVLWRLLQGGRWRSQQHGYVDRHPGCGVALWPRSLAGSLFARRSANAVSPDLHCRVKRTISPALWLALLAKRLGSRHACAHGRASGLCSRQSVAAHPVVRRVESLIMLLRDTITG